MRRAWRSLCFCSLWRKEKPNTFWAYPRARGWNRITETFYPCTVKRVAWRLKSELPNRYATVWRAYRAVKEKPAADRRVNALMRKKTLEALEESGVTRYGLCRALRLNKGNVYAYLAGDDSKVSRKTARRIMEYAEERGAQEGAGRPVCVTG